MGIFDAKIQKKHPGTHWVSQSNLKRFRDIGQSHFPNGKTAFCDFGERHSTNIIRLPFMKGFEVLFAKSDRMEPRNIGKIAFCGWNSAKSKILCFAEEIGVFGTPDMKTI